jgi:hypothetical protein
MLMQNLVHNPYDHFKSPLLFDWCMFIEFHPSINILIQVGYFKSISQNIFVKLMILQCVCGI